MNIKEHATFIFSTERRSNVLPTQVRFVRVLNVTGGDLKREVVLVELDQHNDEYPRYLVLAPRHFESGFFGQVGDDPLFVNIIDGSNFAAQQDIDLSAPGLPFIDIGGLTPSAEEAKRWQCRG